MSVDRVDNRDYAQELNRNSSPREIDVEATRAQLHHIFTFPMLSASPRLMAFLEFVVETTLAGREDWINETTIAQEVFRRGDEFDSQSDSIVRVEAGRLRRRLSEYYLTEGADDPILIEIPKGGYVPHFEHRSKPPSSLPPQDVKANPDVPWSRVLRKRLPVVVGIGCLAIAVSGLWLFLPVGTQGKSIVPHFTKSTEAYAMFQETGQLGRPPNIKVRVVAAMKLARKTQVLDPSFSGGYAAESFQLWHYVLFGHSETPEVDTKHALDLAHRAIEIDPEFGWGYQSLSRALQLQGDNEGAIAAAKQAVELDPKNAEHHGNLGLTLIASGHAAEAIEPINKAIRLSEGKVRTPYLNYLGLAYFHNREFEKAAQTIEQNRENGGPIGPHMYAYLAAAHAMAGNDGRARAIAGIIRSDKSAFPLRHFITSHLANPDYRDFLFSALEKAGLSPDEM